MFNMRRIPAAIMAIAMVALLFGAIGYYLIAYNTMVQAPERSEWAYEMIEAVDLHSHGYFGENVVVAIIDTGIDIEHPEFERYRTGDGNLIWKDYVNGELEPYDDNDHGTAMAGIIASKTYGIAPKVDLIIAKTISASGSGRVEDIALAIHFAVANGADVISLSLGGGRFPILGTEAESAVEDAISEGVFVVAAAGNDGDDPSDRDVDSPSNVELAISAGAVDANGKIADFSSKGDNDGRSVLPFDDRQDPNKKPEVVAPGVGITVPLSDGKYGHTSGTSVSTAFVSGIIALTLDAHEGYQQENNYNENTVKTYKNALMESSLPPHEQASLVHNDYYGYGVIKGERLNNVL